MWKQKRDDAFYRPSYNTVNNTKHNGHPGMLAHSHPHDGYSQADEHDKHDNEDNPSHSDTLKNLIHFQLFRCQISQVHLACEPIEWNF